MVTRFFGLDAGGIDYALRNPTARVLKGDPAVSRLLIASAPAASGQRYTAGVISETINITETLVEKAQLETEKQLLGGLPAQSLDFLWIEHKDKGKNEAHFIVPNLEMVTGKKFSPYVDRIDRYRFRAGVEQFNLQHGLPDPNSIMRVEPDYSKSRLSKDDQELLMKIWSLVDARVKAGTLSNRSDMVRYLLEAGFKFRDKTHAGKPLQQIAVRRKDGGIIRLKGSYYFRSDFDATLLTAPKMEPDPKVVKKRIQDLDEIIRSGLEFRSYHTIGHLFGRSAQKGVENGQAGTALRQLIATAAKPLLRDKPAHPMFTDSGIRDAVSLMKIMGEIPDPIVNNSSQVTPAPTEKPVQNAPVSDLGHQNKPTEKPQHNMESNGPEIDFSAPGSLPAFRRKNPVEEPEKIKPQPQPTPITLKFTSKLAKSKKRNSPQCRGLDDGSMGGR